MTPARAARRPPHRRTTAGYPAGRLPGQHLHRPAEDPGEHQTRRSHATVEEEDTTFRVFDGDQLVVEVVRTTTRQIARFKARQPGPPRTSGRLQALPPGAEITR